MLTQEELDKLLQESAEGEGDSAQEQAANTEDAKAEANESDSSTEMSQEDLDKLLEASSDSKDSQTDSTGDTDSSGADEISWDDAFKEAAAGGDQAAAKAVSEGLDTEVKEQPQAPTAQFSELSQESGEGVKKPELDFLLEIPLEVQVELGRSTMKIRDLLQLGQGSIVELNKMVGEPADIYVNRKLMAKGEVVVVNEKFGIKLTEIISPQERVKSLG